MPTAFIFGAGNIGRGFIGQLFCESGYHTTFIDVDAPLLAELNAHSAYDIEEVFNDEVHRHRVGPVDALNANDEEAVCALIANADLGATAVGARVLPHLETAFARGIEQRARNGKGPLNIILCENLKNVAAIVRDGVAGKIAESAKSYLHTQIGFVEPVIGRMVPPLTEADRQRALSLIRVEPYRELPVDREGFRGPIPSVRDMTAHDNFERFVARKLYIHNCGHAVLGYLGHLVNHEFGWQSLADDRIQAWLAKAWQESIAGIVHRHGAEKAWLEAHTTDLRQRFANKALGDTNFRLGRDPIRKLAPTDRLLAPASLTIEAGVVPIALATTIAAALRFRSDDDPVSGELAERIATVGVAATLSDISALPADSELSKLVCRQHDRLANGLPQLPE